MKCSRCDNDRRNGQRYCNTCHAAYQRTQRILHPLTPEQHRKDIARSYAGEYKRRGKLVPQPCICGSTTVEMHHEDYAKPLDVTWLCRSCHLELHR